eukprot:427789-Heterocapsa_arctica.AAC.1
MANGDLQGDRFQHWCNGCCDNKADCVWKLQTYFVAAVAGVVPKVFARTRWTGQELSLNFIGLLEGCNRLFTKTFERFALRFARAGNVQSRKQPAAGDLDHLEADAADPGGDGLGVADAAPAVEQGVPMEPVALPCHDGAAVDEWELKQQEQSRFRQTVLRWVEGDGPLGPVVVLRACVEVLR